VDVGLLNHVKNLGLQSLFPYLFILITLIILLVIVFIVLSMLNCFKSYFFVNISGTPNSPLFRCYCCLNPKTTIETEGSKNLGKDMTLLDGDLTSRLYKWLNICFYGPV